MNVSRRTLLAGAVGAPVLALTGCAGTVAEPGDFLRLRVMAPASPGGGWDTTARFMQRVIRSTGLARNVQVFKVEGAGGTIGLGQLSRESDDALMMMGLVMVGAVETNKSTVKLSDVTPVARLLGEPEMVVVPKDSPYDTLKDFVEAWKTDTREVPVAGGSAGGTDQILAGLLAKAGGVNPKDVNDIPYSGGGQFLAALLGGKVKAGISGVGEYGPLVTNGDLRGLAVSSDKQSAQVPDVPTITEAGFDVVISNWRGLMTHPGIAEGPKADLVELVTQMHDSPEWVDILTKNAAGAEIPTFLSYAAQKRSTQHPEEFGKGAIEGVAGPEAADNAAAAGVLVPLLTLPLVGIWVKLLKIPRPYLNAGILMFASLGAYAVNAQPLDLITLLAIGLLGFAMRRFGWPVAPAVIGLILGPVTETNLRRALAIISGDLSTLVDSWFSKVVLLVALLALVGPPLLRVIRRRDKGEVPA